MKVKLTLHTPEIEISRNASICYGNENLDKDITSSLVHSHKHLAVLRFAYATFNIEGISIACQNQVVRSKHLDFMVQSKRYVNADKGEFEFIYPDNVTDTTSKAIMRVHWNESIVRYKMLIENGVKKEDARAILPMNTSTKMNITGNLQAFMSFFQLRLNSHAQKEIRALAVKMYDELKAVYPQVFTEELFERLYK